ncbi:MAG TPA: septum formation inhibitor Maf [Chromatiales bacterium]|nr:septum formation inhibitor Maf [Chromatiales bacterium]
MTAGRLVLASASPRRVELLAQLGLHPRIHAARVDETRRPNEHPALYVERLALAKAEAVFRELGHGHLVLGADTTVAIDADVLGKPAGRDEAVEMLMRLSGREHRVLTAVALMGPEGEVRSRVSVSHVHFRALDRHECEAYWESGEPRDKAGAYAIQGLGAVFVRRLEGSYSGVMGLPLFETAELLAAAGIQVLAGARPGAHP